MKFLKREKKYSIEIKELDEYSTRIFHFIYEQKRLPTNQEMFLELKIPSNVLEEVIHYFNHSSPAKPLKKYNPDQLKQLNTQSILIFPFIKNQQINLTEVVIGLNYSTSNARELVNFCNSIIEMEEKKISSHYNLFETEEIELNVVRVVKKHLQLKDQLNTKEQSTETTPATQNTQVKPTKPATQSDETVSILDLASQCRLGVLATRTALSYYEQNRLKIPYPADMSESKVKEMDTEIRQYFADLLKTPTLNLESVLTHPNWRLPVSDPPELTVENVTNVTDDFIQKYKSTATDPITGLFQLAGDAMKNIASTFLAPVIEKTMIGEAIPNPTLTHAQEILSVLLPIRDQEDELAPTYNIGLHTIEYVPAEQVVILKEKDRFFCGLCQKFYPKKDTHQECSSCHRSICQNCYQESKQAGMTKCPVCRGSLKTIS